MAGVSNTTSRGDDGLRYLNSGFYSLEIESKTVDMEMKVFRSLTDRLDVGDKVVLKECIGGWTTGRESWVEVLGKESGLFGLTEYEFSDLNKSEIPK